MWPFWMWTRNALHLPNSSSTPTDTTLSFVLMVRHYSPRKEPPKGTPCHGYVYYQNSAINPSTGPTSKTSVVRRRCHCRRKAAPPIQLVESTSKTWIWLSYANASKMWLVVKRAPCPCNWNLHWLWCSNHSWRKETSRCSIGNKFLHQSLCQTSASRTIARQSAGSGAQSAFLWWGLQSCVWEEHVPPSTNLSDKHTARFPWMWPSARVMSPVSKLWTLCSLCGIPIFPSLLLLVCILFLS